MKFWTVTEKTNAALTGESPFWDKRRNCVWWIDIQGQRLLRTDVSDDRMTADIALPSMPGFVLSDTQDNLLLGLEDGLWSYSPEARTFTLVQAVEEDRPDNRLNEGKADPVGRLWFGSMNKFRPDAGTGALYVRHPGGSIDRVLDKVGVPNTISFSLDSRTLYFADTPTGIVSAFNYDIDSGQIKKGKEFARYEDGGKPDGVCVDSKGGVWIAVVGGSRLDRYLPDGRLERHIDQPVSRPTMATFGGEDLSILYVTSQRRFLSISQLGEQHHAGHLLAISTEYVGRTPDRVEL